MGRIFRLISMTMLPALQSDYTKLTLHGLIVEGPLVRWLRIAGHHTSNSNRRVLCYCYIVRLYQPVQVKLVNLTLVWYLSDKRVLGQL